MPHKFLLQLLRHSCGLNPLLFFRSSCNGPLVTVAMETRPAVPGWTIRGLPLEANFGSC